MTKRLPDRRELYRSIKRRFGNRYHPVKEQVDRQYRSAKCLADKRWERFDQWRRHRPFAGGALLILASLIIGYVPLQMAGELPLLGQSLVIVGLGLAAFVFVVGVLALAKPEHSTYLGCAGIVFSLLSIFGALGGILLGTIVGVLGGSLCVGWVEEPMYDLSVIHEEVSNNVR